MKFLKILLKKALKMVKWKIHTFLIFSLLCVPVSVVGFKLLIFYCESSALPLCYPHQPKICSQPSSSCSLDPCQNLRRNLAQIIFYSFSRFRKNLLKKALKWSHRRSTHFCYFFSYAYLCLWQDSNHRSFIVSQGSYHSATATIQRSVVSPPPHVHRTPVPKI